MRKNTHDTYRFAGRCAGWLAAAMLLFVIVPCYSFALSVKADLSPETFSITRSAQLTITVKDTQSAEIVLPDVEGLSFHERGTSRQYQMINNKSSSSVTYTYLVQALASGSYTIPPITVTVSGSTIKTSPISCTVTNTASSSPGNSPPADSLDERQDMGTIAFLKLIPEKSEGYIGEIIPARIEAYFKGSARARITSHPAIKGEGVLIDPLEGDPQQRTEVVNGSGYNVVTWDTAITGIKEGTYDLEMEMDATIQVQSKRQRRLPPGFEDDFFQDRLFNDFFSHYENQPIRVVGQPVTMKIHDLPAEGKPENFSGAVGQFSFELEVSPTSIGPGDPITLKMRVKGTGNFDNVNTPSLTSEEGLKSYPPSAAFIKAEGAAAHSGEKVFEQAVVVTGTGSRSIPPVAFSYFDPEKAHYQTLFSDPVPITVTTEQAAETRVSLPSEQQQVEALPSNDARFPMLAPVKLAIGNQVSRIRPIFFRPLFLSSILVVLAALFLVTGLRIRKYHLARNPELVRQKKIFRARETLLKQLAQQKELQEQEYLAETQEGIKKLLGLLWQKEAASLTTADIALRLGPNHPVTQLFTWADRSSYGTHILSKEEKQRLHETITDSIRELS